VNNQVLMFRFHGSYEVNWGYTGIKSGGWQGGLRLVTSRMVDVP
jgi:hypothetical protein